MTLLFVFSAGKDMVLQIYKKQVLTMIIYSKETRNTKRYSKRDKSEQNSRQFLVFLILFKTNQ